MRSPFKFLDSYTKDDREIFFGREREIEELYHRVFESKIMLVYGVSGTGKSSLIHCGLANKFENTDWLPIVIRRGGNIVESMAAGILSASITPQQSKFVNPSDFKKGVRSLYLDHYKPVFFLFDQFEELFIFGAKDERRTFINIIKSLVESELQCRIIFVMREEYMAWVTEFEKFIPSFFSNRVRIEKMSHRNAIEAIKGPCKVFNISLEEGFAESLLEKLSPGESEVELTYLQVFLDKIYRHAISSSPFEELVPLQREGKGDVSFTISILQRTGNVSDLLGSFLDDQISLLPDPATGLTLLKSFVSVKGTKQPMKPDEVREYSRTLGREIEESDLMDLIRNFVNLRILCDKDQNDRYELRHDALAAKIYEKFTLAEKELLEVRKFVENAYYIFETRGVTLNKDDLDYLANYENRLILPEGLNDFVSKSRNKLFEQQRALRRITRISALIFILILAAVGRYYFRTQSESFGSDLLSQALTQSETNPVKALNIELDLWAQDSSSSQLHYIILHDFNKVMSMQVDSSDPVFQLQEYLKPVKFNYPVINAELSDKGTYIYGWLENQSVFVHNLRSGKVYDFEPKGELCQITLSERDSNLAIIYKNKTGEVFDISGNVLYSFETTLNEVMNEKLVSFFPSGSYHLVAAKENKAVIFNNSGSIIAELKRHSGRINSIDVSPDARFIVTASNDSNAYIWNFNFAENQFSVYDSLIGHKNIIWSALFNKTGKYIITASADSNIKIWNLYGKQINPEFYFISGSHYRLNNGENDDERNNPKLSKYYGKFCDALLSHDEREIIATGYSIDANSAKNSKPLYSQVLFNDKGSRFLAGYKRSYFFNDMGIDTVVSVTFRELSISPDEKVAAALDAISDKIYLLTGDGRTLLKLPGSEAKFSINGNELIWCSGNEINRIPVTPYEIKRLLNRFKISYRSKIKEENFLEL